MSGISAVIESSRKAFLAWVQENHPSLHDDLWGQYWLAGVAAGLSYTHKAGLPNEQRLAGLIYAASNLKRYVAAFKLLLPTGVELLYDENQSVPDVHALPRAKQTQHNLPVLPTPFIGRATQIAAIKELVLDPDTHLVTLIGPGGTGKTRLGLQVAQESLDHFPDGVYFVPLADDRDANQLISRVGQQLAVREGGRPLLENVKDYLRDKHMLLILDNFEQLVSSAPMVTELLATATKLKIMVTSRITLNLYGESEFPVPPLELPQAEKESTVENLIKNESVILFVERAKTAHPNFVLTNEYASVVAEICHRLDGLPLALELAAARIKILQPQEILARLDDKLKLLTGGARDLPTRQQTLRNTLEWSYDLLHQDEKTLFARLSVFVGGFTLEAAEAVCNKGGKLNIFEGLTALVNNSLLRQAEPSIGETRFGMLETIREFACERLKESGESDSLHERHARYFSDVIVQIGLGYELWSANALRWLNWLERENDNIRATLTWELTTSGSIELATVMVSYLNWFWYRRGYLIEGQQWNARILASPELQTASMIRATALLSSGLLALWQGRQDTALVQFQEGLAIKQKMKDIRFLARQLVSKAKIYINMARLYMGKGKTLIDLDHQLLAGLLLGKGVALINLGRESQARPFLEQALTLNKEQSLTGGYAITLVHLGNVELGLGHPEKARALHEESLARARVIDENWSISFALNNLGEVARTQGQFDQARKYYEESEALLRNTGDNGDLARFVHSLGYVAQHEEDYELAESQFRRALTMFRRLGNRRGIAECLAGLAGLKARQGQTEWGTILFSAAESILKATGGAWWPADRIEVEQNREIMQYSLKPDEFTKAWKTGAVMNIDQAILFASNEP
jgi:predicted ATPase